jgi:hypothetical protein
VKRILEKVVHVLHVEEAANDADVGVHKTLFLDSTKKPKGRPKTTKAATPHNSTFKRKKSHT